jgi:hypothetical protein
MLIVIMIITSALRTCIDRTARGRELMEDIVAQNQSCEAVRESIYADWMIGR